MREELRPGSLRMIDVKSLRAEVPVVRRRGGYRSRLAVAFLELLTAHAPMSLDAA